MKTRGKFSILILAIILSSCISTPVITGTADPPEDTLTPEPIENTLTNSPETEQAISPTPSPTATPDPYANLYGCEMDLTFTSGPLESKGTQFDVLGEDYFSDKGDKFKPGKGTGIYYAEQHYFIIHSSYVNGNILRPMEAEFIRKYLEYWGSSGNAYIQGQIDSLVGSEVTWTCNGETVFETTISGIVRLSHEASNRLWLEPENLEQIILDKEGLASEWIGEITLTEEEHLYIAFCGWSTDANSSDRFTYYRYLLQFEID